MAITDLGRVMLMPRGPYNALSTYEKLDLISYSGSGYVAIKASLGNLPTDENFFMLMVDKGDAFVYSDFTPEQLALLVGATGAKGAKGDAFVYSDFTPEQLANLKGDAFVYSDFTPEQLVLLKGPAGKDGTSIKINGVFNTEAELIAAYPDGSTIDGGFMVVQDYYVWSINNAWLNAGPLKGANGNVMYATFTIDLATGQLMCSTPDDYTGPSFTVDTDGYLEVTV